MHARSHQGLLAVFAAAAVLGLLAILLDWREMRRLAGQTDWRMIPPALLATAVSYAALSAGLVAVARTVGVRLPGTILLRIAFVSVAVNHVLSLGGVLGYSLRTTLVASHGARAGDVLAMSLLHSYLNNLAMTMLLTLGLLQLMTEPAVDPAWRLTLGLAGLAALLFVALSTAAALSDQARAPLLKLGAAMLRRSPAAWRPRAISAISAISDLDLALHRTSVAFRADPRLAITPLALIALDWTATLAAFWFCLDAFGDVVGARVLLGGFAIGIAAGFASLVPGGLGVQEGSMAAVFTVMGVQFEHAVLAAVLFRVIYYFVPFLVSLPFYLRLGPTSRKPRR